MKLTTTHRFEIGRPIGYSHSATVKLGDKEGMLFLTTPGGGVDPGEELFHYKGIQNTWLVMFDMDGNKLWEKELPDGVLPGIWFRCAVALDMDGDGYDEIYFINNTGAPFSFSPHIRIGTQSATRIIGITPGTSVTNPSASSPEGRQYPSPAFEESITLTLAECI